MTITSTIYLEVNSTPLHTYGWEHGDITPLFADAVRGGDEVMPGAEGARPFRRFRDSLDVSLPMEILGTTDADGTPHADPWSGCIDNLYTLKAGLGIAYASGDGTVTATLHLPSTTYSADVLVHGFTSLSWKGGAILQAVLDLTLPGGLLVEDP